MPLKDKEKNRVYHQGYWKEYYADPVRKARHIGSVRKTDKRRREIIRTWTDEYKVSRGCKVCGFNDAMALDFHHREDETKEFNVSEAMRSGWSLERIKKEVEKCDVMCANHHRIYHLSRGRSSVG